MMPEIQIDITKLLEKYLIPIVISFFVGLVSYLTVFDYEWGWPTVMGCGCFLLIQSGIWMKGRCDRNKIAEMELQAQQAQNVITQYRIRVQEEEKRDAAKVFLHSCLETAVGLYNYQKHAGEKETERYVALGDFPGYDYAQKISWYDLEPKNQKYHFLYFDNEMGG